MHRRGGGKVINGCTSALNDIAGTTIYCSHVTDGIEHKSYQDNSLGYTEIISC